MMVYSSRMISDTLFLCSSFVIVLADPPTVEQFNGWQGYSICTEKSLRDHLGEICVKEGNVRNGSKKAKMIKQQCDCKYKANVQFTNQSGSITSHTYEKGIGLCCFSSTKMKCIAKGPGTNTILVYKVSNNVCRDPVQKSYDFSATLPRNDEEVEKGGFSSFCQWVGSFFGW